MLDDSMQRCLKDFANHPYLCKGLNTMDSQLVMGVFNDALEKYPRPESFNANQGF
jgi:hypothetical protein